MPSLLLLLLLLLALVGPGGNALGQTPSTEGRSPPGRYAQLGTPTIVGTWSTTMSRTGGQAVASVFVQFQPDGRFNKRLYVPAGIVDTIGSYRFDPQTSTIHTRAEDYSPKTIPPVEPIGQWVSVTIQFLHPDLFVTHEGAGSLRWVRQR